MRASPNDRPAGPNPILSRKHRRAREAASKHLEAFLEMLAAERGAAPLTLVAYECELITHAYVETIAVGEVVPDMPLFLEPGAHILVPLEATYQAAWDTVPARWQRVIVPPTK